MTPGLFIDCTTTAVEIEIEDDDDDDDGVTNINDVDNDNDGLIELFTLDDLNAMRFKLDGSSFQQGISNAIVNSNGCPPDDGCNGYELMNNLDFDENNNNENDDAYTMGPGWRPIGVVTNDNTGNFTGIFEGNNRTLCGLFMNIDNSTSKDRSINVAGLFGAVSGATAEIRNITLSNVTIRVKDTIDRSSGIFVGALVGRLGAEATVAYSGITSGRLFASQRIVGNIDTDAIGGSVVGGLVGRVINGIVRNSYATVNVIGGPNADDLGGLIGSQIGATSMIRNSYAAAGTVNGATGDDNIGGLVGAILLDAAVENSYAAPNALYGNTPEVNNEPNDNVGILAGTVRGAITNSYASGPDQFAGDNPDTIPISGGLRTIVQLRCPTGPDADCDGGMLIGEVTYMNWDRDFWSFGTPAQLPALFLANIPPIPGQPR